MTLPKNLTMDQVMEGMQNTTFGLENVGFCLACGEEASGCEPDARGYECECCGEHKVYGAEEIFMSVC